MATWMPIRVRAASPRMGKGLIVDTFDFSHGGGTPYMQQAVVENNIVSE